MYAWMLGMHRHMYNKVSTLVTEGTNIETEMYENFPSKLDGSYFIHSKKKKVFEGFSRSGQWFRMG